MRAAAHGSCTHVWNYAQAIPHLFPSLERTLRETEFGPSQNEARAPAIPQRAADPARASTTSTPPPTGSSAGIMKVYREWRISGDTEWLRGLWPKVKRSLDYCIETWDPGHKGVVEEPHHNTYDIEFWGPDGMCTSFYLGALQAAVLMGKALGDAVPLYAELLASGVRKAEAELFDGEYFIQRIEWKNLRATNPMENKSMVGGLLARSAAPSSRRKGRNTNTATAAWPTACSARGSRWSAASARCSRPRKSQAICRPVHKHNLKHDLSDFANPQRPTYACGAEGGLRPLHLAQGRRAVAALRLFERGLDRASNTRWLRT